MSISAADLELMISPEFGGIVTAQLADNLIRVSVPNPRYMHDSVTVTVETRSDGSLRLTDAGEMAFTFDEDAAELVGLLHCSGSPIAFESGLAVHNVAAGSDLAPLVLRFAHALIAAPSVWNALRCAEEEAESDGNSATALSASKQMARRCKTTIRENVAGADPFLRLDQVVRDRDESARAPLTFALTRKGTPRILTSFIPAASGKALSDAKSRTSWLWTVTKDLSVPKFVVVSDSERVGHFEEIYSDQGAVAIAEDEYGPLFDAIRRELEAAGLR